MPYAKTEEGRKKSQANSKRWYARNKKLHIKRVAISTKRRGDVNKKRLVQTMGGKCEICGYDGHIAAFVFHHKTHLCDFNKERISTMIYRGYGFERIYEEAKKCMLLCANCHNIHHFKRDTIS